jgi:hypothetical protein
MARSTSSGHRPSTRKDQRQRLAEHAEQPGALHLPLPLQRADAERPIALPPHPAELVPEPVQVDEKGGAGEAEGEQGHQALAPGEHPGLVAGLGEQGDGLLDAGRGGVLERRRLQLSVPRTRARAARRRT